MWAANITRQVDNDNNQPLELKWIHTYRTLTHTHTYLAKKSSMDTLILCMGGNKSLLTTSGNVEIEHLL